MPDLSLINFSDNQLNLENNSLSLPDLDRQNILVSPLSSDDRLNCYFREKELTKNLVRSLYNPSEFSIVPKLYQKIGLDLELYQKTGLNIDTIPASLKNPFSGNLNNSEISYVFFMIEAIIKNVLIPTFTQFSNQSIGYLSNSSSFTQIPNINSELIAKLPDTLSQTDATVPSSGHDSQASASNQLPTTRLVPFNSLANREGGGGGDGDENPTHNQLGLSGHYAQLFSELFNYRVQNLSNAEMLRLMDLGSTNIRAPFFIESHSGVRLTKSQESTYQVVIFTSRENHDHKIIFSRKDGLNADGFVFRNEFKFYPSMLACVANQSVDLRNCPSSMRSSSGSSRRGEHAPASSEHAPASTQVTIGGLQNNNNNEGNTVDTNTNANLQQKSEITASASADAAATQSSTWSRSGMILTGVQAAGGLLGAYLINRGDLRVSDTLMPGNSSKVDAGFLRGRQDYKDLIIRNRADHPVTTFLGIRRLPHPGANLGLPIQLPNRNLEKSSAFRRGRVMGFEDEKTTYKRAHPKAVLPSCLDVGYATNGPTDGLGQIGATLVGGAAITGVVEVLKRFGIKVAQDKISKQFKDNVGGNKK